MSDITYDGVLNLIEKLPVREQRRLVQTLLEKVGKVPAPLPETVKFRVFVYRGL